MDLKQYNILLTQYNELSLKVDLAYEVAQYTDDYDEYEYLKQELFDLELQIPRIKP